MEDGGIRCSTFSFFFLIEELLFIFKIHVCVTQHWVLILTLRIEHYEEAQFYLEDFHPEKDFL